MPERRARRGVPRQGEPSDDLILAALERAELHDGRPDDPAVLYAAVVDHLGLKMGSSTGYWFRPRFRALVDVGLVTSAKRNGLIVHALTGAARQRLRSARAADRLGELPESPQHRRWREARAEAAERIGGYREQARSLLDEGAALLTNDAADSEAWFALAKSLGRACEYMGAATHCLNEWAEPSDDAADVDDGPRRGRRDPRPKTW
jgi:hypothetical protein